MSNIKSLIYEETKECSISELFEKGVIDPLAIAFRLDPKVEKDLHNFIDSLDPLKKILEDSSSQDREAIRLAVRKVQKCGLDLQSSTAWALLKPIVELIEEAEAD